MTPEQRAYVQELLQRGREDEQRPEITLAYVMRYLQTQDVAVAISDDVEHGTITLTF
jgi:hypothetical protein